MTTNFTVAASTIYLAALAWCLATAPWRVLAAPTRQHGWMGLTVALLLAWTMRAPISNGMELHLGGPASRR